MEEGGRKEERGGGEVKLMERRGTFKGVEGNSSKVVGVVM